MIRPNVEQKIFDINDVKVGGLRGKDPTVLIGTMFYRKQRLVEDEKKGMFDRDQAEGLIRLQEELSDTTGNPCMLDVEGSTSEALEKYIDFAAGTTESPLMIGGSTPEVRKAGLEIVSKMGLEDRVVYNSLMPDCDSVEIETIVEAGVRSAVLLGYVTTDLRPSSRVEALKELLKEASRHGINKPLLDTFVMDIPSLGLAFEAMRVIKNEIGYPTGCGPHNAIGLWKGLRRKMGLTSIRPVVAAVNAFAAAVGADWILYGPIEAAREVFPSVAMVDAAYALPRMQQGNKPDRSHPMFRIA